MDTAKFNAGGYPCDGLASHQVETRNTLVTHTVPLKSKSPLSCEMRILSREMRLLSRESLRETVSMAVNFWRDFCPHGVLTQRPKPKEAP